MMESKTKPKKKGFNLFDDDDDDIEETATPSSTNSVPERPKAKSPVIIFIGSGNKTPTTPRFGYQAQQQAASTVLANTMNTSVAATNKPVATSTADQPVRFFGSRPTATTTCNSTMNTSSAAPSKFVTKSDNLLNIFRSRPRIMKATTTTSNLGQHVQRTALRGNIPGDEQVQAFLDSRAASKQQTRILCVNNASKATGVEQLRPVIKNTNVTPVVAETRSTGIPKVSTSVQTAANEEQVQPVKAPMIVQQPKAAVAAETCQALSKLQPVTMATVEQQTETSSAAAVPSDKLGLGLMALPNKDFVFKVKYDQVPIHKTVLGARSYYFYQQFYENSGNSSLTFENADDFDKEVIELAVRACYGQSFDETTLDARVAEKLVKFADIYGMSCVKNLLQQTLANCLTEETVCSAAIRSYDTNDYELRKKCAAFVAALILQNKSTPRGIEELPADFFKETLLAIIAEKNKKQ